MKNIQNRKFKKAGNATTFLSNSNTALEKVLFEGPQLCHSFTEKHHETLTFGYQDLDP